MSLAYERDPARIYAESFAAIAREARLGHLEPEAHDLAVRVIHACGMVEVGAELAVSPGAVSAGRAAPPAAAAAL
ncbi:precorrin-8X methylmutase [Mangrovicoccus ximenensis]|uniref:precorrin-8X methylmutase n=1 Tax=Mangrovicoccus ximenensis TaxID=1911570 RepID=UPI000D3429FC|nr:precorrin-8X methylmutase [Mangrovicoccus ximenensis]